MTRELRRVCEYFTIVAIASYAIEASLKIWNPILAS